MDAEAESPWMDLRRAVEGDTSYSTISTLSTTAFMNKPKLAASFPTISNRITTVTAEASGGHSYANGGLATFVFRQIN